MLFQDLGFFSETAHEREKRSDRYEARWHAHGSADFSAWSLQRDFKVFNGSVVTHGYPSLSPNGSHLRDGIRAILRRRYHREPQNQWSTKAS